MLPFSVGQVTIRSISSPVQFMVGFRPFQLVTNNADGGAGDDHITISGTTGFFTLDGTITNHATGGSGDDVLDATAILQSINSLSASNFLDGGAGNDVLRAYCSTDSDGGSPVGINELSGGNGNDMLQATQVTDGENGFTNVTNHLDGGNGNDVLVADSTALARLSVLATNHLEGGNGNDSLTAHLVTGDPTLLLALTAQMCLVAALETIASPRPSRWLVALPFQILTFQTLWMVEPAMTTLKLQSTWSPYMRDRNRWKIIWRAARAMTSF